MSTTSDDGGRRSPLFNGCAAFVVTSLLGVLVLTLLEQPDAGTGNARALAPLTMVFGATYALATWWLRGFHTTPRLALLPVGARRAAVFAALAPWACIGATILLIPHMAAGPEVTLVASGLGSVAILAAVPSGLYACRSAKRKYIPLRCLWQTIVGVSLSVVLLLLGLFTLLAGPS